MNKARGKKVLEGALVISLLVCFSSYADEGADNKEVQILPLDISSYSSELESNMNIDELVLDENIASSSDANLKQIIGVNATKHFLDKNGRYVFPGSPVVCIRTNFDTNDKDIYNDAKLNSLEEKDKKYIKKNDVSIGTGVLISPDTVLTCAHIFFPDVVQKSGIINIKYNKYPKDVKINSITVASQLQGINAVNMSECYEVNMSSDYLKLIKDIQDKAKKNNFPITGTNTREGFNCDFVVLKLEEPLGDEAGWLGVTCLEKQGSVYGEIYGFPVIEPSLPKLNKLEEVLIADTKLDETVEDKPKFPGKAIKITDMEDNIDNKNSRYYGLLTDLKDAYIMYSSRSALIYEKDNLMKYRCSTYSGQSGGPIIVSKYNNDTRKVEYFTSGIHCGYFYDENVDPSNSKKFGDLMVFVRDYLGNPIDFNKEHKKTEASSNRWITTIEVLGYNRGREIDPKLYNCLIDRGWTTGKPQLPKELDK